ncbi:MAG TPA: TetR/AcrR family transcriptional regulator [Bacillota bacterium]|nr:TetR/AcrR family transcriptional regulator [Bacillota bacterium]
MPRSKEQFEDMRERSKKLIMETALTLFASRGFHATSISQIAKECGVATGLLYNYYDSKEHLLEAIIQSGLQEFAHTMHQRSMALTKENIAEGIRIMFSEVRENHTFWKLCFSLLMQPDLKGEGSSLFQEFFIHMDGLFTAYFRAQGNPEANKLGNTVSAVIHGALLHFILSQDEETLEAVQEAIIERFL